MKKIAIIGSINMDLVTVTPRFPKPGETLTGDSFSTYPGGKGANQAVAAARLGADVTMIGKVGDDIFGDQYLDVLRRAGVGLSSVGRETNCSTGLAIIEVDASGENHIILIPGANARMTPDVIDSAGDALAACDTFLLQLEIPVETVVRAVETLAALGKTVILDPAPARELPEGLLRGVDFITPNETEAEILTGVRVRDRESAGHAGRLLLDRGCRCAIIKAGAHGAYVIRGNEADFVPGFRVNAIDTTAAGDSFNAGFAVALSGGPEGAGEVSVHDAVRFAHAVAAISTTAKGAQTAMPDRPTVEAFLAANRR